jgi:hypothetical protein
MADIQKISLKFEKDNVKLKHPCSILGLQFQEPNQNPPKFAYRCAPSNIAVRGIDNFQKVLCYSLPKTPC